MASKTHITNLTTQSSFLDIAPDRKMHIFACPGGCLDERDHRGEVAAMINAISKLSKSWGKWSAALNHEDAIAYSRLSKAALQRHERTGRIRFLPHGTKGQNICLKADLDSLLTQIWLEFGTADINNMDFGAENGVD